MNIFAEKEIAQEYDAYYGTPLGKQIDLLEKQMIEDLIQPMTPGKLLEIGCGTGHWTAFFSQQGFKITATDVSEAMLELAREKQLPNTEIQTASVFQLPFPDNHFDQVGVITALEFCGDIPRAFAEIKRVLKPGGWLIAGCLNADSILGKNKAQDPVFKHAHFMKKTELHKHLSTIGEPILKIGVHLSPEFKLVNKTTEEQTIPGVFMAATVQKTN
ncbi:class I SAM-dependent methyltransferase [Sunxiuqinia sp. sy24]|uniref:class I SAM-dependent methyltransferase n=1 Tax=Sunxiuqinia sp. sy24 TaxID=3461495 RepID=UPI004045AE98